MRRLLLVLALLLAVTACSDDGGDDSEAFDDPTAADDDQSDAPEDDDGGDGACDLLGDDDVAELLDRDLAGSEEEELSETATQCTWSTEEPSEVVDSPITLTIERGELDDDVTAAVTTALDDEANEVLDIGDSAVLVCGLGADGSDCDQFDSVIVVAGDTYLEVDLSNWGYPDDYSEDEGNQIMIDAATQAADALG